MYHFGLTVFYGMQSRKKDFSDICDQITKLIRPPQRQPTVVTKASPKEPIRACVPSDIYCDVCSIQFNSQPSFSAHMSTKAHILTLEQNGKLPLGLYEEFKKALLLTKWFTFAIPPMTTTLHEEKLRKNAYDMFLNNQVPMIAYGLFKIEVKPTLENEEFNEDLLEVMWKTTSPEEQEVYQNRAVYNIYLCDWLTRSIEGKVLPSPPVQKVAPTVDVDDGDENFIVSYLSDDSDDEDYEEYEDSDDVPKSDEDESESETEKVDQPDSQNPGQATVQAIDTTQSDDQINETNMTSEGQGAGGPVTRSSTGPNPSPGGPNTEPNQSPKKENQAPDQVLVFSIQFHNLYS